MSYPRFLQRLFANGGAGPKLLGSIIPFGAGNPKAHGTASPGTFDEAARADHVHPGYGAATQSASGLLTAADKKKLDGIAAGAQVNPGNMKGATASTAGAAGLVPAPAAGSQATKYLRADGTWQTPPDTNTTYSAATQSATGLMSAADKTKLDNLAANGMTPVFDTSDPAYNRVQLALNTEYTAPSNGYIIFSAVFINAAHVTWGGNIWNNIDMSGVNNNSGTMETCRLHHAIIFPVARGQKILFRADNSPSSISYYFYAAK